MLAEKTIRKHVSIIHAYSLMSSLQRKIINVLLYEAIIGKTRLDSDKSVAIECRIPLLNLRKAVKFSSNNTQYLKEAIDGLASLKIEWNLLKDKAPTNISFLNLRVLHGAPTFYQDGSLNFSFHKVMLDLIDNPSIYGTVDMDVQAQFDSKYGHALYENSTRFVNLQKNKIIQLDTFRKLLGVHKDKYLGMRELTRNVVMPSVNEVNDRADFVVSLDGIKCGRKITAFEISVKSKKKSIKLDKLVDSCKLKKSYNEITQAFGTLSNSVLDSILRNYPEEYILEKIAYTTKYAKKEKSGFYPIPYFISALRDNYKSNENTQSPIIQDERADEKRQHEDTLFRLQSDYNHWKKIHEEYAQSEQNKKYADNIQKVMLECERKLQQFHLEHQ